MSRRTAELFLRGMLQAQPANLNRRRRKDGDSPKKKSGA
jgi:hypothetical protein